MDHKLPQPFQRLFHILDSPNKPLETADLGTLLSTWLKPGVTESLPKRPRHAVVYHFENDTLPGMPVTR
ncbi:MAG TPA: hypothetical protein VH229_04230 [Candidatus Udaeobacter sp.]|jgi:hypothetical protein|nr:hypothetical protein [Candidatus Udaeobacter sp.]